MQGVRIGVGVAVGVGVEVNVGIRHPSIVSSVPW